MRVCVRPDCPICCPDEPVSRPGWRARLAERLALALAELSKLVGQ